MRLLPTSGKDAKSLSLGNTQSDHTPSPQATPTPTKTSPPPVTFLPSINSTTSNNTITSSNGEVPRELAMMSSTAGPSRSDSVSSDTGIVYFAPHVAGETRTMATGDGVRDRCRGLLAKAMMKGFEKGL